MRTFGKWLGRVLLALLLAAIVIGLWKREEIERLLAVNSLFSEEKIVHNFSHMDGAFLSAPISRGDGLTSELAYGPETELPDAVDDWIAARDVTALVVLKDGAIVYENYFKGTGPEDRRISWSVAKSYLSALVGILLEEGQIASLDDPVTKYAPSLKGSAYDDVTVEQLATMHVRERHLRRRHEVEIPIAGDLQVNTTSKGDFHRVNTGCGIAAVCSITERT